MLIRFHSVFLLSESQPKKIRKVPPGLPSSVSVSIQKRCCPELYLSPHSQSMGAHVFVFYDPFSHSIWHLKPLLGSQSSRIAAIQDFQLLQLCICTTELRKKKKKEGGGKPLIHPVAHLQHIFIVCCICGPFTLRPHFFPSAKYTR